MVAVAPRRELAHRIAIQVGHEQVATGVSQQGIGSDHARERGAGRGAPRPNFFTVVEKLPAAYKLPLESLPGMQDS